MTADSLEHGSAASGSRAIVSTPSVSTGSLGLKRSKDARQAAAVLGAVADSMPHFPIDETFISSLPEELFAEYEIWHDSFIPPPRAGPSWW